jgi:RHS repeat-associated protein
VPDVLGGFPKFTFFIYDHLGNSRILYSNNLIDCNPDSTKYLLEHVLDYYPFAKTLREYIYVRERHQSTYHERDEETGLDYRGARFYDSEVGRFLSVDPLADIPKQIGMSPYSAMGNNPIIYIDPDGRCFTKAENGDYVPCDGGSSGDTRTGAFGNSWTYGEDSWQLTNTNENPDYSKANQVTPTGELNYYEKRYQNHINEYGTKPPDYYLEYGFNYAKKFSKDLRSDPEISDDLRKWIDETVVGLQVLMEVGIQESTNKKSVNYKMQGNNKAFRTFAFKTHVPAYTQSGTLKTLPAGELFKIFKQVKPADMVKPDGIKQAIDIVPKLFE